MGIETLQRAALAAGFVMATPDDDPPPADAFADTEQDLWQPAQGQWLVPLAHMSPKRSNPRDAMVTAAAWLRDHLPLMGRAPA